jgi:hypothetical protein
MEYCETPAPQTARPTEPIETDTGCAQARRTGDVEPMGHRARIALLLQFADYARMSVPIL